MPRQVSLPMYDFPEVASATSRLVDALVAAYRAEGVEASVAGVLPTAHHDLMAYWSGPEMLISQSCGLPFVEDLASITHTVGTFRWSGVSDERGWYRTVIVAGPACGARDMSGMAGARPAVSNTQSLSGWCSLGVAVAAVTDRADYLQPAVLTGSHAGSLAALRSGDADVASIDPGTFQLLARHRPDAVAGIRRIGEGPSVPATPLVVPRSLPVPIERSRSIVAAALNAVALADARADIGIDSFVVVPDEVYVAAIPPLVEVAQRVLPRA